MKTMHPDLRQICNCTTLAVHIIGYTDGKPMFENEILNAAVLS